MTGNYADTLTSVLSESMTFNKHAASRARTAYLCTCSRSVALEVLEALDLHGSYLTSIKKKKSRVQHW